MLTVPATYEPMAAIAKRRPGAAVARHLVSVDASHDGCRLAGNTHQDRSGRTAVHRAIVDAGEQHDRRGSVKTERSGKQQADAGERTDARQDARPECRQGSRQRRRGGR